jgi:hypothetical protein
MEFEVITASIDRIAALDLIIVWWREHLSNLRDPIGAVSFARSHDVSSTCKVEHNNASRKAGLDTARLGQIRLNETSLR